MLEIQFDQRISIGEYIRCITTKSAAYQYIDADTNYNKFHEQDPGSADHIVHLRLHVHDNVTNSVTLTAAISTGTYFVDIRPMFLQCQSRAG